MSTPQQTDNSNFESKVLLRLGHLPIGPCKVLDAFGGFGLVWDEVAKRSGRQDIYRFGIDKETRPGCVHGDNRKWLKSLDLNLFEVIDLDAYGIPFDQLEIIFKRKFNGTVFFTMIQIVVGMVPMKLVNANGISDECYRACPSLFAQIGWTLFVDYLANKGVTRIFHRSINRKHYGGFVLT